MSSSSSRLRLVLQLRKIKTKFEFLESNSLIALLDTLMDRSLNTKCSRFLSLGKRDIKQTGAVSSLKLSTFSLVQFSISANSSSHSDLLLSSQWLISRLSKLGPRFLSNFLKAASGMIKRRRLINDFETQL